VKENKFQKVTINIETKNGAHLLKYLVGQFKEFGQIMMNFP